MKEEKARRTPTENEPPLLAPPFTSPAGMHCALCWKQMKSSSQGWHPTDMSLLTRKSVHQKCVWEVATHCSGPTSAESLREDLAPSPSMWACEVDREKGRCMARDTARGQLQV